MEDNDILHCIKCNSTNNLSKYSPLKNRIYVILCLYCKGRIVPLMYRARSIKNKGVTKMSNSLSRHFELQLTENERKKLWDFWMKHFQFAITKNVIKKILGTKD